MASTATEGEDHFPSLEAHDGYMTSPSSTRQRRRVDEVFFQEADDEPVKAYVAYNSEAGRQKIVNLVKKNQQLNKDALSPEQAGLMALDVDDDEDNLDDIQTMAVNLTKSQLRSLQDDDDGTDIGPIEKVETVSLLGESVSYGIGLAAGAAIPTNSKVSGDCRKSNAFKVAIIDSGIGRTADAGIVGGEDTAAASLA